MTVLLALIPPLSGAVIGYFTNWLAIKMLFRPYNAKKIGAFMLPFTPGLIPKERYRLSEKVSDVIAGRLLTGQTISDSFDAAYTPDDILSALDGFFENIARDKTLGNILEPYADGLPKKIGDAAAPVILRIIQENDTFDTVCKNILEKIIDNGMGLVGIFLNKDKIFTSLKTAAVKYLSEPQNITEIEESLTNYINEALADEKFQHLRDITIDKIYFNYIRSALQEPIGVTASKNAESEERVALAEIKRDGATPAMEFLTNAAKTAVKSAIESVDIKKLVKQQLDAMDLSEAERIVISVAGRELKAITYVGGVLGFIIGLVPTFTNIFLR